MVRNYYNGVRKIAIESMAWNCYTMNNSIRQPKQFIKSVDREMKEGIIGMEKRKNFRLGLNILKILEEIIFTMWIKQHLSVI